MIDRVLIVGLGSIGRRHLELARQLLPKADISVLRHQPASEIPEFADGVLDCIEDAVAFAPRIAVVANPAPFHVGVAQALAEAGTHLLIEKPLAASLDGVGALIATCRERGVALHVGYNLRFMASLQRLRKLVLEGAIGRILSVRSEIGQHLPSWRRGVDYRRGVTARRELGGGALLELSHEIDYLRWIFGEVEWINALVTRQSALEIDIEDIAYLQLSFASGETGPAPTGSLIMDLVRHDTTRTCVAIGETGSLRWNALAGSVEIWREGAKGWEVVFREGTTADSYPAEWTDFLAALRGEPTCSATGEDGAAVLAIIDAARLSAATGAVARVLGAV